MISGKIEERISQRREDEVLIREVGDDAAETSSIDGYQELPERLEGEGEWTWHLKLDEDAESQTLDIILPDDVSTIKLMIQTKNSRDSVNAFLYASENHT